MSRKKVAMLAATAVLLNMTLLAVPPLFLGRSSLMSSRAIAFLIGISVLCLGETFHSFRRAAPSPPLAPTDDALALATGVSMLLPSWIGLAEASRADWLAHMWPLAAVIFVVGLALRLTAIRSLGRFFVTGPALLETQPLLTGGVYGLLRHPSDTGIVLATAGGAALLANPLAVAIALGTTLPLTIVRIRRERAVLELGFGAAYRRYATVVPAGLPDRGAPLRSPRRPTAHRWVR